MLFKSKIFFNIILLTILLPLFGIAPRFCLAANPDTAQEELFFVAQKAFEDGFYDVALRYLEEFQLKYPQSDKLVQARLLVGQCYFLQSQYLKAYTIFQELLASTQMQDATNFWLGETYLKGGDYSQAAKYYQIVIKTYPDSEYAPQAYYSLGWTYFEQGNYPDAIQIFLTLLRLYPAHILGEDATFKLGECEQNLGHYSAAVEYFTKYLHKYPQSTRHSEIYFYIAEANYFAEDYLNAITYYAKAADQTSDNKLIYMSKVSMGWCYLKLEKMDLAERNFKDAETLGHEKNILNEDVYFGLAHLFEQTNHYDDSLRYYNTIINDFPNNPKINEAYIEKGNLHYYKKEYPLALEAYNWVISNKKKNELDEELEKALYGIAWTHLKSGDPDGAIKTFEKIIKLASDHLTKESALTQIGNVYMEINKLQRAIDIYDRILKEFPDSIYADFVQFQQAVALLGLKQIDAASLSFQSLKTNFPTSKYVAQSNYYLSLAYFQKEEWLQSIIFANQYLESGQAKRTLLAEINYLLALSHYNLKQYKDAMVYFDDIQKGKYDGPASLHQAAELYFAKCLCGLGQNEDAIKKVKAIVDKYPLTETALDALVWLGDFYLQHADYEIAIEYYQQAIKAFPLSEKNGLINYEIGQAYAAQGQLDQAIKYYQLINEKAGEELYGKARIAIADLFSQDLSLENAIESYQKIAQTTPEFARDAYIKIGLIFKKHGKYSKAIESFQAAEKISSDTSEFSSAELLFLIADTQEILNEKDRAIEIYLKIPYLYKNETEWVIKAYLRVARIFEEKELWQEAAAVYSKVLAYPTAEAKYAQERLNWIKTNIK